MNVAIGVLFLLVLGFIWLLTFAWPEWLLYPPALFATCWLLSSRLRQAFRQSFRAKPSNGMEKRRAIKFAWGFFIYGVVAGLNTMYWGGRSDIQWWFLPICSLAIAAWQFEVTSEPGIRRALCKNLKELLMIAATVLGGYVLVLESLSFSDLEAIPIERLEFWEEQVKATHETLEHHKLTIGIISAILVSVLALRLAKAVWPSISRWADRIPEMLVTGVKWSGRLSTIFAIAASITLLATDETGPIHKVTLTLKNAEEDYKHFAGEVQTEVDHTLRQALVLSALRQRPENVQNAMARLAAFDTARSVYNAKAEEARWTLHQRIERSDAPAFWRGEIPDLTPAEDDEGLPAMDQTWTSAGIRKSESKAKEEVSHQGKQKEGKDASIDELSDKIIDRLSLPNKLFSRLPIIAALKDNYPVFGELLDAVSDSISETMFRSIRNRITAELIQYSKVHPEAPMRDRIGQLVAKEMEGIRISWTSFDESWDRADSAKITKYQKELADATIDIEKKARAEREIRLEQALSSVRNNVSVLDKIGRTTESPTVQKTSTDLEKYSLQLKALVLAWPMSGSADADAKNRLERIESQIRDESPNLLPSRLGGFTFLLKGLGGLPQIFPTRTKGIGDLISPGGAVDFDVVGQPLRDLEHIDSKAADIVLETIHKGSTVPETASRLRTALGDNIYDSLHERAEKHEIEIQERAKPKPTPEPPRPPSRPPPEIERPRIEHPHPVL